MSDLLIEMGKKPWFRKVVKGSGVPIPTPLELKRQGYKADPAPLKGRVIGVFSPEGSPLNKALGAHLCASGARLFVQGGLSAIKASEGGNAIEAAAFQAADGGGESTFGGLVFDGSAIEGPEGLKSLYEFMHPLIRQVERHGRVVLLSHQPKGGGSPRVEAVAAALEGMARSLAKEVGKKGITVNTLHVMKGGEGRLGGPLNFLLGRASAYVTGQPLTLGAGPKDKESKGGRAPLQGKVALVTGAAQGIGAETARVLAGQGAKVICLDRAESEDALRGLAGELGGEYITQDVTAGDAGARLVAFIKEGVGQVDIVVHNAGVTRDKTLAKMSDLQWDLVVAVNLKAVIDLTEALLEGAMAPGGRFVCVSSVSGIAGNVGQTNYAATKAGVLGYVRGMAKVLGPKGMAINAVAPGFIETAMTAAMPTVVREAARRMNALSQGGHPEDVAQAIAFLGGAGSLGVNGQHLRVCGQSLVGS